jgi:hypothetical protein
MAAMPLRHDMIEGGVAWATAMLAAFKADRAATSGANAALRPTQNLALPNPFVPALRH